MPRLLIVFCAHALAHHSDHRQADGRAGNVGHRTDIVADGIGRDSRRAEGGDEPRHQQLADLEHAVFQPVWHAHAQDAFEDAAVPFRVEQALQKDGVVPVAQQQHHHQARHCAGCQRSCGRARHAPVQAIDEQRVAADVDNVHDKRCEQRNAAVAHAAEQRRPRVVQRQHRV